MLISNWCPTFTGAAALDGSNKDASDASWARFDEVRRHERDRAQLF
jgi:hypothetical protein